ncbi:MAG: DsbA family oxidoreductase [Gammaproteobacteria bacterium]|nr:DsbA family oxidoreductase [Gammaproteobacteria bacterium]MBU1414340.1 DsbA family oxidoreductase [Gammaproteobacteria bacterium]
MLTIEIVSDFVCPWCYIGTARLKTAVAMVREQRPDFAYRPFWKPFFLNPDTPPEGEPYLPFLVNKFGGIEKVEAIFERVRAAGRPYGIEYAFEKIPYRANTLKAHRLAAWAQAQGEAVPLIERLYSANFQRGEHIGDPDTLVRIAGECGYDTAAVSAFLASHELEAEVLKEAGEVVGKGITMVPTFIIGGKEIIVGAEDPAILAEGIRKALA